jgi:hypothetical protein
MLAVMNTSPAQTEVLLEWTYSPRDFFESPIEIPRLDYTVDIGSGSISARLAASAFDADTEIKQRLHDALFNQMRGIQLLSRKQFQLSRPRLTRIEPDGRRHIFMEPEGAVLTLIGGLVDFTVTDASGRVVRDTKQERIERKRELAKLVAKYGSTDEVLRAMLESHATSTSDPNNELVHLYEIREALSSALGSDAQARAALGISRTRWSRLGQLCNDEPLRQGRHRGKDIGALREATESELSEARDIAQQIIEVYLAFRENGGVVK